MAENETPQLAKYTTETLIALADQIDDPRTAALRELHAEVNNIRNCIVHINNAIDRLAAKSSEPMACGALSSIAFDLEELKRKAWNNRK